MRINLLHRAVVAAWLLLCVWAVESAFAAEKQKRVDPELKFLREVMMRLPEGLVGRDEAKRVKALSEGKNKALRPLATAVSAGYERIYEEDCAESIRLVAPYVLGGKAAKEWQQAFDEKRASDLKRWKEEARIAKQEKRDAPPEPKARMYAPFPAAAKWTITGDTLPCVIELIRAHMEMGEHQAALEQLSAIGEGREDFARVLCAECGGDLLVRVQRYPKAIDFYKYALESLDALRKISEGQPRRALTRDELFAKQRIERSLAQAKRLWDIERYGEGWVLYRDAENLRIRERRYLDAIKVYDEIRTRFPKTVYSEAATGYTVKCLIVLSTPEAAESMVKSLKAAKHKVTGHRNRMAVAKLVKLSKQRRKEIQADIDAAQGEVDRLRNMPNGPEALKEAEQRALAMSEELEFGLYRGEAMVDLARYRFEKTMEPDEARARYERAWAWLEKVDSVDAALETFTVPAKAREVSSPPAEEMKTDAFGNLDRVTPDVGDIVNRRTCRWYLDDLREQCALALGFLCFVEEKRDEAVAWFEKVSALDQKTAMLEKNGEWNDRRRLVWGAKHGYLYAFPEELKLYNKRQRFAVLLADFHFCTERFGKAKALSGRLLAGEFGKLDRKQTDYPHFLAGSSEYWLKDRGAALAGYEKVLEHLDGTFTEDRAAFTAGNLYLHLGTEESVKRGEAILARMAKERRTNEFGYQARVLYGSRLLWSVDWKEGEEILRSIPEDAGGYFELAAKCLELHEKKKTEAKEEREQKKSDKGKDNG